MRFTAPLAFLLAFALIAGPALATVTVQPASEAQSVWVAQGEDAYFQAFLTASSSADKDKIVTADVDADSKITVVFPEGKDKFTVTAAPVNQYDLLLRFSAASDAPLRTSTIRIKSGEAILYTFTLSVVIPPEDIVRLQDKAETGAQIQTLNDQLTAQVTALTTQLTSLQTTMQSSLDAANSKVTSLSSENSGLKAERDSATAQLSELKAQRDQLQGENTKLAVTGNLIGGASPLTFAVGLLVGAAAIYLALGRKWGWVHKQKPSIPQRPL